MVKHLFIILSLYIVFPISLVSAASTHITIDTNFREVNGDPTYSWADNKFSFGDLDGDGKVEFVLEDRTPYTGFVEQYSLHAIDDNGNNELWSVNLGFSCSQANYDSDNSSCWQGIFTVWDFDSSIPGDEVATAMKIGGSDKIALLNGNTGAVIRSVSMSKATGTPDKYIQYITAAYLDGNTPSIVVQYGTYSDDHVIAYDKNFNQIWRYDPQDYGYPAGGGHLIYPIEVDQPGDARYGKDDIIHGAYILDHNGNLRFGLGEKFTNAPKLHADATYVWDFLKDGNNPGKEALFCIEGTGTGKSSQYEGVFMVNTRNKDIVWSDTGTSDGQNGWDHCHNMFFGDFLSNSGLEIWASPRAYYIDGVNQYEATGQSQNRIYSTTGNIIKEHVGAGDPIEWNNSYSRTEISSPTGIHSTYNGSKLRSFPVETEKNDSVQADFGNDGREELLGYGDDGNFHIFSNLAIDLPLKAIGYDHYYWILRANVAQGHWNWVPKTNAFGEIPGPTTGPTNTPSSPSATNTPIPIPTSTPVPLPGDIDGDGDVDIFDYNILIGEFGITGNSDADINGDGRVDIFDYNLLVGNFGSSSPSPTSPPVVTNTPTPPTGSSLEVTIHAIPSDGSAPLVGVDLRGTVSGTATGLITWQFDCTNDGNYEHTTSNNQTPYTVQDLCDYLNPGTYTTKVVATRGGLTAQDTFRVEVY